MGNTVAYLNNLAFDDLSKENFPTFKAKIRSSILDSDEKNTKELAAGQNYV